MEYCRAQQNLGLFCRFWDPWWNYLGIDAEDVPNILMRAERVKLDSSARTSRNKNTSSPNARKSKDRLDRALVPLATEANKSAI